MKKRIISLCVVVMMIFSVLSQSAVTANAEKVMSGVCGDNLIWSLDESGTLTISGVGEMYNFGHTDAGYTVAPWNENKNKNELLSIVIEPGVTSIGNNAFLGCSGVTNVSIPNTVTLVGPFAFDNCSALKDISIPEGVTEIGSYAFSNCGSLKSITIPSSVTILGDGVFDCCWDLSEITFLGNAPTMNVPEKSRYEYGTFWLTTATVYYPVNNPTWTSNVINKNYGGDITWVAKEVDNTQSNTPATEEEKYDNGYISAVQKAIEETKCVMWGGGYGLLYDIDGNDIPELILVYTVKTQLQSGFEYSKKVCSVYSLKDNNEVVVLMDQKEIFEEIGGSSGFAAVIKYDGEIYFSITWESGETGGDGLHPIHRGGEWELYKIQDDKLLQEFYVEYDYYVASNVIYNKSTSNINGEKNSYKAYEEWRDSLETLAKVDPIEKGQAMTLEELLMYLEENTVEANPGITETGKLGTFNSFFVENHRDNILQLCEYESAAKGICDNSTEFQVNWNAYLAGLSDKNFLDLSTLSFNLHYYYEVALLESLMETKLSDDYVAALTSEIAELTVNAIDYCVKYDANLNNREQVLKDKLHNQMTFFRTDSSEFLKIKEFYGKSCKQLENFDTVKNIYDLTVEAEGSVEDFYNALSNYAGICQVSDEIKIALIYLRQKLELSKEGENAYIYTAVNNLINTFERDVETQLIVNVLKTTKDQLWNVFYACIETVCGEFFNVVKLADVTIDSSLTLSNLIFPTTISSTSYCKIYADYGIENILQNTIRYALSEYETKQSQEMADIIVGLYDILGNTYKHEIEVASVLSKQLNKDGLLNSLRNFFSSGHSENYEYEQACIQAYSAYLNEILRNKTLAQNEFGLAIGALQPVCIVCNINGKVIQYNEITTETGKSYQLPLSLLRYAEMFGLKAEIGTVYTDEAMTTEYNENEVVLGPLVLYCNVHLTRKDGTLVLLDGGTGIRVAGQGTSKTHKLQSKQIVDGDSYDNLSSNFPGSFVEVYDIVLLENNIIIQPESEVCVEIPIASEYKKVNATVYRIESDGTLTDMQAVRQDGYYRFSTEHFSEYAVVYEKRLAEALLDNTILIVLCMSVLIVAGAITTAGVIIAVICVCKCKKHKKDDNHKTK